MQRNIPQIYFQSKFTPLLLRIGLLLSTAIISTGVYSQFFVPPTIPENYCFKQLNCAAVDTICTKHFTAEPCSEQVFQFGCNDTLFTHICSYCVDNYRKHTIIRTADNNIVDIYEIRTASVYNQELDQITYVISSKHITWTDTPTVQTGEVFQAIQRFVRPQLKAKVPLKSSQEVKAHYFKILTDLELK